MFRHTTPTSSNSIADSGMARSTKDWSKKIVNKATDFGLTSKGDTRLTEHKNQELLFNRIQQRYLTHCGSSSSVPALDAQFTSLSINANHPPSSIVRAHSNFKDVDTTTLESILMDMRKLREGLLASARIDEFSTQCYIFITCASILMSHPESYVPSLKHLLYVIHPQRNLTKPEVNELAGYLILHHACGTQSYHDALTVYNHFHVHDFRVMSVVRSLISGNYWLFWSTKKLVDGYKSAIMDRAATMVRWQTLKVVGRTYLNVDVSFLQNITSREWAVLKEEFDIGWEKDGETVYIKKQKAKAKLLDAVKEEGEKKFVSSSRKIGDVKTEEKRSKDVVKVNALELMKKPILKETTNAANDNWTKYG